KQLPPMEVKKRSKEIAELARDVSLERNRDWVGWEGEVLIDEKGTKSMSWIGRNFAYKPFVVKSSKALLGRFVNVRALRAFPTYLEAEIA
ncbi:MAG: TRAM domain-containing protein, partial [Candidatus Bathyarchaeota archaeon]